MIEKYIDQFKKINVAKRDGLKAPHKAVLLLAVIDLVEQGVITTPKIELTEDLESTYQNLWNRYVYNTQTFQPRLTTPFWHLSNEDFWRLRTYSGPPVSESDNASSVKSMREKIYALLDVVLFEELKKSENRAKLRVTLISNYF